MNTFLQRTLRCVLWLALLFGSGVCLAQGDVSPHGELALACVQCHSLESWQPLRADPGFDHGRTRFPPAGRHAGVRCTECHRSLVFKGADARCSTCHLDIHRGQFSQSCDGCHTPAGWQNAAEWQTRHQQTRFPLTGAHADMECQSCHAAGQYVGLSTECHSCHASAYQTATEPDHVAAGFSTTCTGCHEGSAGQWSGATFAHTTAFPLTGGHAQRTCNTCHAQGYRNLSAACLPCHRQDYDAAANPNHAALNLSTDCATCHQTTGWQGAQFDHNLAPFTLTGTHQQASCLQCHPSGQYTGTADACVACHREAYTAAENPSHSHLSLPETCEQCHTTAAWSPAAFDHNLSSFALTGAHVTVECADCHTTGTYAGTPAICQACHAADYAETVNPNHTTLALSEQCIDCHTTDGWRPAAFEHSLAHFPLTGAHQSAECAACHTNGQYPGTPSDCWSCHRENYTATLDPNHVTNQLPQDCTPCHSTSTWEPALFDHAATAFALTGAHTTTACGQCHVNGQYNELATDCWSCHNAAYTAADNPRHVALALSHECQGCHTTAAWQPAQFDHSLAAFALTGAHVTANCVNCHPGGQYAGTPTACFDCHDADYRATGDPDHETAQFPHDCQGCHTTAAWEPSSFTHTATAFPLVGAHLEVACGACHVNGQFAGTATACFACHEDDFAATTDPDHGAAEFARECLICHTMNGWAGGQYDHSGTGFVLTGAHQTVRCATCHGNGVYAGTSAACFSCHAADYAGAADPNHVAGNYDHTCAQCHTTSAWAPATFDHALAQFPLTGQHASASCVACHVNGQYTGTPQECFACHETDFQGAANPNHAAAQFPHGCEACHTPDGWTPSTFNHATTSFPLTGAHVPVSCAQCHVNGQFVGLPSECWSCHEADYASSDNPAHAAGNFPHGCAQCHTTGGWSPATFDHTLSEFQLTGAHVTVSCADCHSGGQYTGTPQECFACHDADYAGATDPDHSANQFPHDCTPCHTTAAWQPSTFSHTATAFPLTGAHLAVQCASCHVGGQYANLPGDCWSCHEADYTGTTDPNHAAAQFSHGCTQCHTTANWDGGTFDHNTTAFALTGAHAEVTCFGCHSNGVYSGLPSACNACHLADYQAVTDPNHVQGSFPQTCQQCHTTAAWIPAVFDHSLSDFPLTGAHVMVSCNHCHANGQYTGTPQECFACHSADFAATSDPGHVQSQFPHECMTCHSTSGWSPSTFSHAATAFPLTGAHVAASCVQCHQNGQYSNLPGACFDCHSADYATADNPNHAAAGFSHACGQCHTTMNWDADFNHNVTAFPLTGAHTAVSCQACHPGGQYSGRPTDCYACHEADYAAVADPNHAAGNFPHTCVQCHATAAWTPAQFDHNLSAFPLTGAHIGVSCTQCHVDGHYTGTSRACFTCHSADYAATDDPSHTQNEFPHECATCHSTSGWSPSTFNHSATLFPLTGAHVSASCVQCHPNGQYSGLSSACYDCHAADYASTDDPDHAAAGFSHACEQCHATANWDSDFNHNATGFALTGAHATTHCNQCHTSGQYADAPTDCWSCHEANSAAVTDPNHAAGNYSHLCQTCHTTIAWQGANFNHDLSAFTLTGQHATVSCTECHADGHYTGTPTDCYGCHAADFQSAANPGHVQNSFPHGCTQCHTTSGWAPSTFHHATTAFPLTGAHSSVSCADCHTNGQYSALATDCYSCHAPDYQSTTNPGHAALNLSHLCTSCHTTSGWSPALFDHSLASFALTGAHQGASCVQCHVGGQYSGTPTACFACHGADFTAASDPNHTQNQFPHECSTCHTTSGWAPSTFSHAATSFPLSGAHVTISCVECHRNGQYSGLASACYDCHSADYAGTDDPNHVAAGFPHTCQQCHTTTDWDADFNHNATAFPLTGAHATVNCGQCHAGGVYAGTSTDCYTCHQADYQATDNPGHSALNLPHGCTSCHTTGGWSPAQFDHNLARFPLTGAHQGASCVQCHAGGQYSGTSDRCWDCHATDYSGASDPGHAANQFPHDCQDCHGTAAWQPSTFNHAATAFPLTGAHNQTACASCHVNGQYQNLATACGSCHLSEYTGTNDPQHAAAGFSQNCANCHTTTSWAGGSFNHSSTSFPLTGAHQAPRCVACHSSGQYNGLASDCWSCHQPDYAAANDPDHTASGFPHDCSTCHATSGWSGAQFDHALSGFPLTGAHTSVTCAQCHVNGQYTGTPADCYSCHGADYLATTNPGHAALVLSHTCTSCHTTGGWSPAQFDHNLASFALTGAHRTVSCSECHVGGQYSGTPETCFGCHSADYTTASDPGHTQNQFPHECTRCHTTTGWEPSTFNHAATAFPLTGAHLSTSCAQCHPSGQYSGLASACYDCHSADYAGTDDPAHAAAGFPHTCQQCHTTTNWDAAFDHSATGFALTGAHMHVNCNQCHTNGQYAGTPSACFDCHQTDYQEVASPSHTANQFPHDCRACHSLTGWQPATFSHSATAFPLTGAHLSAICIQCHSSGQYANLATACWSCHEPDYRATDNPDHEVNSFPHACTDCHSTSNWAPASFNHDLTPFPLHGAHTAVSCLACHPGGQYAGTPSACYSCHRPDFEAVLDPNHVGGGFDHTCTLCHSQSAWHPASFNHNSSSFPLTGAHITVSCTQCHAGGHYTGTPTDCYPCHTADYQGTNSPSHVLNSFPHACASCHTTSGWTPSTFSHATTGFPLTGAHVSTACAQCHQNGQYSGLATDCYSCHQTDFQGTTDPGHVALNLSQTCTSCHTTGGWTPAQFDHNLASFALTGAHRTVSCSECHPGGQYSGTPGDCWSCHQTDYSTVTNPNHALNGFPHTCQQCHGTSAWEPSTFNHTSTGFALTGGHTTVSCGQCHIGGQYQNTPSDCYACHAGDFANTDNPDHTAAQFSHTCLSCHTVNGWTPASFNHSTTGFALTGAHLSANCAACHVGGQYQGTPTDCYFCHQADYSSATNPNHAAAGFPQQCQLCHTTGNWDAQFNHDGPYFPIYSGEHRGEWDQCTDCHTNPNNFAVFSCVTCHEHNQADMNDEHDEVSGYSYSSAACYSCHPRGDSGDRRNAPLYHRD